MNQFEEAWQEFKMRLMKLNVVARNAAFGDKDAPIDLICPTIEDIATTIMRESPRFQQFHVQLVERWKEDFGPLVHVRMVNWPELATA